MDAIKDSELRWLITEPAKIGRRSTKNSTKGRDRRRTSVTKNDSTASLFCERGPEEEKWFEKEAQRTRIKPTIVSGGELSKKYESERNCRQQQQQQQITATLNPPPPVRVVQNSARFPMVIAEQGGQKKKRGRPLGSTNKKRARSGGAMDAELKLDARPSKKICRRDSSPLLPAKKESSTTATAPSPNKRWKVKNDGSTSAPASRSRAIKITPLMIFEKATLYISILIERLSRHERIKKGQQIDHSHFSEGSDAFDYETLVTLSWWSLEHARIILQGLQAMNFNVLPEPNKRMHTLTTKKVYETIEGEDGGIPSKRLLDDEDEEEEEEEEEKEGTSNSSLEQRSEEEAEEEEKDALLPVVAIKKESVYAREVDFVFSPDEDVKNRFDAGTPFICFSTIEEQGDNSTDREDCITFDYGSFDGCDLTKGGNSTLAVRDDFWGKCNDDDDERCNIKKNDVKKETVWEWLKIVERKPEDDDEEKENVNRIAIAKPALMSTNNKKRIFDEKEALRNGNPFGTPIETMKWLMEYIKLSEYARKFIIGLSAENTIYSTVAMTKNKGIFYAALEEVAGSSADIAFSIWRGLKAEGRMRGARIGTSAAHELYIKTMEAVKFYAGAA
jgi:hypothetical protein